MPKPVLILDAFGVLYKPADDVAEFLIPFVREHGGTTDAGYIKDEYRRSSLGQMTSAQFWKRVGLDSRVENEYIALIPLSTGVREFLDGASQFVDSLWCLSNDISEWSEKLRARHEIASYFSGFVISGDIGSRKPDSTIYEALLARVGRASGECIFVDDRVKNLDAAKTLGFRTVLFGGEERSELHQAVASFAKLTDRLSGS